MGGIIGIVGEESGGDPCMKTTPYGSWKSPISAQTLVAEVVGLGSVRLA